MPTVQQVTDIADKVVGTVSKARLSAESGGGSLLFAPLSLFGSSDNDANVLHNLDVMLDRANEWRSRGVDSARVGSIPSVNGWAGWVEAGQVMVEGASEQLGEREWLLPAIVETVKDLPREIPGNLRVAGGVVGDGTSAFVGGFLKKGWWVVLLAGVGVAGWVYTKKKLLIG